MLRADACKATRGSSMALGRRVRNMKLSERNRDLTLRLERDGAQAVAVLERCSTLAVASSLGSPLEPSFASAADSERGLVARVGALLRSASRPEAVPSRLVVSYRSLLPNNTLVLTAQRLAPLGSRSASAAPAAQRGRWTS